MSTAVMQAEGPGKGAVEKEALPLNLAGRIPELDGLRGVAIGMVVICHYLEFGFVTRHGSLGAYLKALPGLSWSGVDLFFVLSGFLIGGILLDARESSNYFAVFYTRRFFRIVPIYVVILLLFPLAEAAIRSAQAGAFSWLFANSMPWYSYATFTQNIWMVLRGNYGGNWLAPTWSLCVEEQFYLTLPLLIRLLSRQRLVPWLLVFICSAPVLRSILVWHSGANVMRELVVMPCRADALLMGVLAAVIMRDAGWRERIARSRRLFPALLTGLLAGVALLARFAPGISFRLMRTVGFTWLALFYACILLFAILRQDSWLSRSLRNRLLMWLGSIAYGVYLIHQAVQGLVFGYFGERAPGIWQWGDLKFVVISLGVTLAVAAISWQWFEKPFLRLGHKYRYEGQAAA